MRTGTVSAPPEHGQGLRSRGRLGRRALLPALALSALLHFLAFVAIRFPTHTDSSRPAPPPRPLVQVVEAMQAFDITVVAGDVAPVEVQIRERRDLLPIDPLPVVLPGATPGAQQPGNVPAEVETTPLRRLEYRRAEVVDVWKPPPEVPLEVLAPEAVVRERIASRLQEYNDSLAGEAAARTRATDWTVKDGEGGRWGVSPGKIHLGDVTLPLPFAFSPPPGRRDEIAGRVRTWHEINAQAARAEGEEIVRDRIRAIRERAEQERAKKNAGGTTGTTGGGG